MSPPGRGPGRGKGQGRGRGGRHGRCRGRTPGRPVEKPSQPKSQSQQERTVLTGRMRKKVLLVLHGNRQTGQLLLGRLERLRKRLWKEFEIEMVAPDAPFVFDERLAQKDHGAGRNSNEDNDADNDTNYMNNTDTDATKLYLTWWNRDGDNYVGLEKSIEALMMDETVGGTGTEVVGILGFSQGARMAHLVTMLHQQNSNAYFPDLKFVILVAGYHAPVPPELLPYLDREIHGEDADGIQKSDERNYQTLIDSVKSLHIWGENDTLVSASECQAVSELYDPSLVDTYAHPGTHFVPMKASDMHIYMEFISQALQRDHQKKQQDSPTKVQEETSPAIDLLGGAHIQASTDEGMQQLEEQGRPSVKHEQQQQPDEESAALQREEIMALDAIFPDVLQFRSSIQRVGGDGGSELCDEDVFEFPIVYDMKLLPNDDDIDDRNNDISPKNWPARPLTLRIRYPYNYPLERIPQFSLIHENNIWEFPSARVDKLMTILNQTATDELGMPSVLSCFYAARDYLDAEADPSEQAASVPEISSSSASAVGAATYDEIGEGATDETTPTIHVAKSTEHDIAVAIQEGLDIAESFLNLSTTPTDSNHNQGLRPTVSSSNSRGSGGGSFGTYTMGLVGKPSAGKSTFFNAATAFGRQRGQQQRTDDNNASGNSNNKNGTNDDSEWGGASMAAHPFTTIDPNISFCLVPAPRGSCPEDYIVDEDPSAIARFASSHGRDPNGRRFLPVLLKDVAGLVPGAYQGRGRGNQFLNDLTDATVLIHVVDASGTSDESGNKTVVDCQDVNQRAEGDEYSDPMNDLAWIRNELVEWVFSNLLAKWEVVVRKGKPKLAGMFSGYGQKESVIDRMLLSLETFMERQYGVDRIYDNMSNWTEADVHRLVSLFLGVRFPMALCLNKVDLPSATTFVKDIQASLPIHGAHAGTPIAAKEEMLFVRNHLRPSNRKNLDLSGSRAKVRTSPPTGVWKCLSSAIMLQEPLLVFPVNDLSTLAPLPGLSKVAMEDPSLPSKGMIECIKAAGGTVPTCWNVDEQSYTVSLLHHSKDRDASQSSVKGRKDHHQHHQHQHQLRDVLLMRPGSTVEDVFFFLKRLGALGGEFVRAEAFSGRPGGNKPKPIAKNEQITAETCVIKIMSNKRSAWQ